MVSANLIKHEVHVIKLEKNFSKSLNSGVQIAKADFDYEKVLTEGNKKFRIDV